MSESVVVNKAPLRHLPPSTQKIYQILRSQDVMRVNDLEFPDDLVCVTLLIGSVVSHSSSAGNFSSFVHHRPDGS